MKRRGTAKCKMNGTYPATGVGRTGCRTWRAVPDGHDELIDRRVNWTLGCISLKSADIEELYSVVLKGTPVEILH